MYELVIKGFIESNRVAVVNVCQYLAQRAGAAVVGVSYDCRWCRRRRRRSGYAGVSTGSILWHHGLADALRKKAWWPLHSGSVAIARCSLAVAIDHVKTLVWVTLIQTHFELPGLNGVVSACHVPFDVENTIGSNA